MHISITNAFGYHTHGTSSPLRDAGVFSNEQHIGLNLINVAGYIPIIGGFQAGYLRLHVAKNYQENRITQSFFAIQVARSIFEFLGLGILFLIPDIIVTIGRLLSKYYCPQPST